jgi:hypothetical protein
MYDTGKTPHVNPPRLNPLVRIGLERFLSDVEASEFHSHEFNVVMLECFREALRIEREERQ